MKALKIVHSIAAIESVSAAIVDAFKSDVDTPVIRPIGDAMAEMTIDTCADTLVVERFADAFLRGWSARAVWSAKERIADESLCTPTALATAYARLTACMDDEADEEANTQPC